MTSTPSIPRASRPLELAYSTGTMGDFKHLPPFVVARGEVVDAWGREALAAIGWGLEHRRHQPLIPVAERSSLSGIQRSVLTSRQFAASSNRPRSLHFSYRLRCRRCCVDWGATSGGVGCGNIHTHYFAALPCRVLVATPRPRTRTRDAASQMKAEGQRHHRPSAVAYRQTARASGEMVFVALGGE